jgi:hypothetical protein
MTQVSAYEVKWLVRAHTFSSTREQTAVDIDEICICQKLHNHAGGNDGAYSQFHESASIGGQDDTHPIEWVRRVGVKP